MGAGGLDGKSLGGSTSVSVHGLGLLTVGLALMPALDLVSVAHCSGERRLSPCRVSKDIY